MHYSANAFKRYARHLSAIDASPSYIASPKDRRDPDRDRVVSILKESGVSKAQVSRLCGVTRQTLRNWETERTRCPQHVTMAFALRAVGKRFVVVDD